MPVEDQIALLTQRVGVDRFHRLLSGLDQAATRGDAERLLRASEFFRALFERQIDWLEHEADLTKSTLSAIFTDFNARLDPTSAEAAISADLRVLRQRAMLHIVWRSFTSQSGLDETLAAMSALADFVIKVAVRVAKTEVTQRFGQPIGDDTGSVQGLIVIGMGKLGGRELNLSSDIDIIFAYDESGATQGGRSSTSNQEFFTRVAQRVIRLIDAVTQEGRVFRVDTRLRPFGESGALVASYQSLENYYQQHGRDWERYALLKARCITGTLEQTRAFEQLAQQFVYRRYTDFSVIDGLRDMKALIDAERVSKGLSHDIKRGPGGIREAEFVVQSHQLVRGGRIPAIQKAGFQEAAKALSEAECLAHESAQTLLEQYRYLRQVEHAIQALRDEQTHAIPETDEARSGLCLLLRYDSWDAFYAECQRSRTIIATAFDALLETSSEHSQLIVGIDTEAPALDLNALNALQVVSEQDLAAQMTQFVAETRFRVMEPEGSRRLQKTLPLIVKAVDRYSDAAQVLQRVLAIVTSVLKRSAYLVLLSENPRALSRLVDLVAKSRP
ncbi:MAG: bifunctional [glutamate--ammonia ligase]-adenylyl-L-tyrosine phosphorylase/[glutamate--ammonia-ligase] adenylyltransferase, partial [Halieaceae bacterium]|nr:bifunctional [glutamate--ammonia ligase]-adenylyl-L-tyrosine phosphorylase/[glutamate--ammonia-ligase] adenylyltransferase [Halieaceae bacterium]